jgi:hypothetical protein
MTPVCAGQRAVERGEALFSALMRLSTARGLQKALEREQTEGLGRERDERQESAHGSRHG